MGRLQRAAVAQRALINRPRAERLHFFPCHPTYVCRITAKSSLIFVLIASKARARASTSSKGAEVGRSLRLMDLIYIPGQAAAHSADYLCNSRAAMYIAWVKCDAARWPK